MTAHKASKILLLATAIILSGILHLAAENSLSGAQDRLNLKSWASAVYLYTFEANGSVPKKASFTQSQLQNASVSLSASGRGHFSPWTEQTRTAGFTDTGEIIITGVNGGLPLAFDKQGEKLLLAAESGSGSNRKYTEFAGGRTLGSVFSSGDVFFHFYSDSFFPEESPGQPASDLPVLVKLSGAGTDAAEYSPVYFEFARENPGWEPVEMLERDGEYLVSWKYTDERKTMFRYIRHSPEGASLKEINEQFFRDEYRLLDAETAGFELNGFIRAARGGFLGDRLGSAGDIFLNAGDDIRGTGAASGYPAVYRSEADRKFGQNPYPVELAACSDGTYWYILFEQTVLRCGENIKMLGLPELPEGFRYREIITTGKGLLLGWEESRFPYVGKAGLMYIRFRDIIK